MRQYALDEVAETAPLRTRHRDWYLTLAERALPELTGPEQRAWYRRLTADYDNLRLGLVWSRAAPDGAEAELRLAAALGRYWNIHGPRTTAGPGSRRAVCRFLPNPWSESPTWRMTCRPRRARRFWKIRLMAGASNLKVLPAPSCARERNSEYRLR
jgi:hypothetical protein